MSLLVLQDIINQIIQINTQNFKTKLQTIKFSNNVHYLSHKAALGAGIQTSCNITKSKQSIKPLDCMSLAGLKSNDNIIFTNQMYPDILQRYNSQFPSANRCHSMFKRSISPLSKCLHLNCYGM